MALPIPAKKIIAICQSGGEFDTNKDDGSLSYSGGDAYALDLDQNTQLNDFKKELGENFQCSVDGMCIKYFLPGNKKTLISVSKDKDLKRMINFFKDSDQVEIFVVWEDGTPASRSSRTTVSVDIIESEDQNIVTAPSPERQHCRAAMEWENTITGVDQRFNSFTEFREALHKYSIAHEFSYKYKKNDSHRVTVKCKSEGCPWRIYASRLATTQLICIKKMTEKHTCCGSGVKAGYRSTRGWVGNIIKEKLKAFPSYKPKDIANDMKREYGIELNYSQAWRAKEVAREQLQGSYKEAYNQLPVLCEKIMETNPGSHATFGTNEDSSFQRLFVSFHASILGFQQCRPLLFLDTSLLYAKYQGTLLAATAPDGNDAVFPVAFAIVDEESCENWHWFLSELKSALSLTSTTTRQITFICDFQNGIKESLYDIFGKDCYHGYCLRYLVDKLNKDLCGTFSHEARRLMVQDLYAAAYAPKVDAFERCVENIKAISPEAYNWVMQCDPQHWANAYFNGARYNHMTSNFGQVFYDWVSQVNELPITQMVDMLRGKMMELIYSRRVDSCEWGTRLTPLMEEKLENESLKVDSLQLQVSLEHGNIFEVHSTSSRDTVDIDHCDCSCKIWQLSGLPCCHAIAVFEYFGSNIYEYCSTYFTTERYHLTYAQSINPIPNLDNHATPMVIVTPPPTKRPPGRPKLKQHPESLHVIKRQLQCSNCKGLGHNKRKCERYNDTIQAPEGPEPLFVTQPQQPLFISQQPNPLFISEIDSTEEKMGMD